MNLDFNEICRLCLRFCEEYVDLNQTNGVKTLADDVVEKIKYCYVVKIDLSEGFPTKICYECIRLLTAFYAAKKNVFISEQLLRDIIFVRKRVQQDTRSQEENVTSPDIIEIKQDKPKIRSAAVEQKNSEPKNLENSVKVPDVQLSCGGKYLNTTEITATPVRHVEKRTGIYDSNEEVTIISEKLDSKVKKKKKLERLRHSACSSGSTQKSEDCLLNDVLNAQNSNLEPLLKFGDLRKEQHQNGRISKAVKDKAVLGTDPPLKENVVKEIGTVIDTNNILSPNVKRTRKSILAS